MMRILLFIGFILASSTMLTAQEMDITVSVNLTNQAAGGGSEGSTADPEIFRKLESEISEMINNNTWTDDSYEDHEKISGSLTLTVTEQLSTNSFKGELTVTSARPVFNSTYTSQLIKYLDRNVTFTYDGLKPIYRSDNNYIDNLSSILTYYVYYIIGMDYESFSPNGGEQYFDKAFEVYSALPQGLQRGDDGWTSDDNSQQNRYFLLENMRSPSLKGFRSAFYEYHRKGLDTMHEDPEKARAVMLSSITQIGDAEKRYSRSILIRMFSDAKDLEIVEVFSPSSSGEKSKVIKIMTDINPTKEAYKNLR